MVGATLLTSDVGKPSLHVTATLMKAYRGPGLPGRTHRTHRSQLRRRSLTSTSRTPCQLTIVIQGTDHTELSSRQQPPHRRMELINELHANIMRAGLCVGQVSMRTS